MHWNLGKRQKSFTVAVFLRDLVTRSVPCHMLVLLYPSF